MYTPPSFAELDRDAIHAMIDEFKLAQFITATEAGPLCTPLPMFLDLSEGECGVLYGHLARPNPQWHTPCLGDALAVFSGPDAYITPSWYASKAEHGKVVPTWNYSSVQVSGPAEFFDEPDRLHAIVTRLTELHEGRRERPWSVDDAPAKFVQAQLRGIVGVKMTIRTLKGKRKLSQNRSEADRAGVVRGLAESSDAIDRIVAGQMNASG